MANGGGSGSGSNWMEESAPALAAIPAMDTAAGISIETIPTDRPRGARAEGMKRHKECAE